LVTGPSTTALVSSGYWDAKNALTWSGVFDADGSASVIPLYLNDRVMVDATSAMHRPLQFQRQDLRRASRCRRGRIFTPGLATAFAIFFILAVAAFNQAGRFGSALGGA
jgi:hypothetical protein